MFYDYLSFGDPEMVGLAYVGFRILGSTKLLVQLIVGRSRRAVSRSVNARYFCDSVLSFF